jgi:hypothetical protein
MAGSALALCSQALIRLGAAPISSFDEEATEAIVAQRLYPISLDALLSSHPWNFAITQRSLARLSTPPVADFDYAFQLPENCLRVISAGTSHRGYGLDYRLQGNTLATSSETVILTYICRTHETLFPPFFCFALVSRLAADFCLPLTDNLSRWKALQHAADQELRRAKLLDTQQETTAAFDFSGLVEERY